MTPSSPYQPPHSAITPPAPARYGAIHPFSARGRLGRVRYIGYSVGLGLLINLLMAALGGVSAVLSEGGGTDLLVGGGFLMLAVLAVVLAVLLTIQRLHDFDASGWWSVLNLLPLANLVLYLVLLIMPGTQGTNRFGDPPPPNSTGVIVVALVVPIIAVIGLVAAIAIPAYQDYTERAAREAALNAPPQPQ